MNFNTPTTEITDKFFRGNSSARGSDPFAHQRIYDPRPETWNSPQRPEINRLDQEVRDRAASGFRDLAGAGASGIAGAGSFMAGQPAGVVAGFGGAVALTGISLNEYSAANKANNQMNQLKSQEKTWFNDKFLK